MTRRQACVGGGIIVWLALTTTSAASAATFDYLDPANESRAIRLWLPEGIASVRGVIV